MCLRYSEYTRCSFLTTGCVIVSYWRRLPYWLLDEKFGEQRYYGKWLTGQSFKRIRLCDFVSFIFLGLQFMFACISYRLNLDTLSRERKYEPESFRYYILFFFFHYYDIIFLVQIMPLFLLRCSLYFALPITCSFIWMSQTVDVDFPNTTESYKLYSQVS